MRIRLLPMPAPRSPRGFQRPRLFVWWMLAALLIVACGRPTPPAADPSRAADSGHPAPLTVAIVLDQLATHALERYWDALPPEGVLRRAGERGAVHRRVAYPYAGTYTAPGHATVHTGVTPREHGIVANRIFDRARGEVVASVDDGEHPWLSDPDQFAGPGRLAAPTVADRLKEATSGRSKVVALSGKDRGAILPGGRRPDLALWYDPVSGQYTTSTYYADALPEWVEGFHEEHPAESMLTPWVPEDPQLLAHHAGADDAPGEGGWLGLGATFPHDPRTTAAPLAAVMAMPQASERVVQLAWEAAQALDLGGDDVPDLLSISISGTDYAGHVFGPHSWEYLDHLRRVDRALGELVDRLEARSEVAVLVTSDHGVAPLPEEAGEAGGRIDVALMVADLERNLDEELEEGSWVAAFAPPFISLTEWARAPERRERALAEARRWLRERRGIEAVFEVQGLADGDPEDLEAPLARAVAQSIDPDAEGDLFVVPARHFVFDERMAPGRGTTHGSPWPYDREVPVVFWGPGVVPRDTDDARSMTATAPTLEALLGLPPRASTAPLPGAPR